MIRSVLMTTSRFDFSKLGIGLTDPNLSSLIYACSDKNEELCKGSENMKITSPAFQHGEEIPSEYTCDGSDTSPELNIEDVLKILRALF